MSSYLTFKDLDFESFSLQGLAFVDQKPQKFAYIEFENGYQLVVSERSYGFDAVPLNHEGKPLKELLLGDDFFGTLDEQDLTSLMLKMQKMKPHKSISRQNKIKKIIDE